MEVHRRSPERRRASACRRRLCCLPPESAGTRLITTTIAMASLVAAVAAITTTAEEAGSAECSYSRIARCMEPVQRELGSERLSLAATPEDLRLYCHYMATAYSCIESESSKCSNELQKHYKNAMHAERTVMEEVCRPGQPQQDYLEHAPCFKAMLLEGGVCHAPYARLKAVTVAMGTSNAAHSLDDVKNDVDDADGDDEGGGGDENNNNNSRNNNDNNNRNNGEDGRDDRARTPHSGHERTTADHDQRPTDIIGSITASTTFTGAPSAGGKEGGDSDNHGLDADDAHVDRPTVSQTDGNSLGDSNHWSGPRAQKQSAARTPAELHRRLSKQLIANMCCEYHSLHVCYMANTENECGPRALEISLQLLSKLNGGMQQSCSKVKRRCADYVVSSSASRRGGQGIIGRLVQFVLSNLL